MAIIQKQILFMIMIIYVCPQFIYYIYIIYTSSLTISVVNYTWWSSLAKNCSLLVNYNKSGQDDVTVRCYIQFISIFTEMYNGQSRQELDQIAIVNQFNNMSNLSDILLEVLL